MSVWRQATLTLTAPRRGCHLITDAVVRQIDLSDIEVGLVHLFLQHTSASLTINENADSDVRADMEDTLNALAPESRSYRHDAEGRDDMPAHAKASLLGCSLAIPVTRGQLALGTWQGVWLCEHRDRPSRRHIVITVQGMTKPQQPQPQRPQRNA